MFRSEYATVEGKQYLLDTNILSDLIRNPAGPVSQQIRLVGEQAVCTSLIVAAELRFGAHKRGSKRLSVQLEAVLGAMDVLPMESPCDQHYANLRLALERTGTPIGGNDMLIAAQALALGLVLVTHNRREFDRIPGLRVEDWLE